MIPVSVPVLDRLIDRFVKNIIFLYKMIRVLDRLIDRIRVPDPVPVPDNNLPVTDFFKIGE